MAERFHTSHNQNLQNAYGAWAATMPIDSIVAIALSDPIHAISAFFACAHVERRACIVTQNMLADLDNQFTPLTTQLQSSNTPVKAGKANSFITFTSGSTNKPKAIVRNQDSWIYSFERNGVTADDSVAVFGSLSHSLAHYAACEALHMGAKVIFCAKRLSGNPTVIYATPTQIKLATTKHAPQPNVRLLMIGGGHFTKTERAVCKQHFPNADIRVFYGTAETSFISIADENTPDGSVGQVYDGVNFIVSNRLVAVQTPMLALGYLDKVKPFDQSTPFETGELGWIDAQGNLFLYGRSDRAVTIADKSVHLDAIEADLLTQINVARAGVIALPDSKRGLRAYGATTGASAAHPLLADNLVLDEWPELLSGKTDYVRLTKILTQAFL